MKMLTPFVVVVALLFSCTTEPEPIRFGKDACYTCKMTLMDKKFGAEIVTKKGKVYKFDDLNCMVNFHNSGYEKEEDMEHRLVIDYANPEKLIDTQHAFFIKSDALRTPMASEVAAFSTEADCQKFNKRAKGVLMSWGEVVTQFK